MNYSTIAIFIDMDLTHDEQMRRLTTLGGGTAEAVTLRDLYDVYQQLQKRTHDHVSNYNAKPRCKILPLG